MFSALGSGFSSSITPASSCEVSPRLNLSNILPRILVTYIRASPNKDKVDMSFLRKIYCQKPSFFSPAQKIDSFFGVSGVETPIPLCVPL
jgi:hypothetical protein